MRSQNLKSAKDNPTSVTEKLSKELTAPFDPFRVSPLGIIPKKSPGEFRLIHHLSLSIWPKMLRTKRHRPTLLLELERRRQREKTTILSLKNQTPQTSLLLKLLSIQLLLLLEMIHRVLTLHSPRPRDKPRRRK